MNKPTAAERRHMARVAELPCVACGDIGVHVHHIGTYMGGGRDNMRVIPLCPFCHTGAFSIHNTKKAFEKIYGTQEQLLEKIEHLLLT